MNYYEARQTKDKTGWHFTCMNDGSIWPVGYCRDHEPHDTREQAEECFAQYLRDDIHERTYADWTGCEAVINGAKCDTPTKKALGTRPPLGHDHALCDEHRDEAHLLDLVPEKIERIVASY